MTKKVTFSDTVLIRYFNKNEPVIKMNNNKKSMSKHIKQKYSKWKIWSLFLLLAIILFILVK